MYSYGSLREEKFARHICSCWVCKPSRQARKGFLAEPQLIHLGEVRARKPSLTLNLGTNSLKVTSEPHQWPGRRGACKGRITKRSPIQAAATLDVA
ncbi:hypothetical protein J6590_051471 [Homalodisca vitripennis]|nr:hypothetical protein J6590_051471 [Homalodisca vitripennis]